MATEDDVVKMADRIQEEWGDREIAHTIVPVRDLVEKDARANFIDDLQAELQERFPESSIIVSEYGAGDIVASKK